MHDFSYVGKSFYCENVNLGKIVQRFGTPTYVYSYKTLTDHYLKLDRAFDFIPHTICYSIKANSNVAICKLLADQGCGADVVSGGELYRAIKAGVKPDKIVYAGVGKTKDEIKFALLSNILLFNSESQAELELINKIAGELNKRPKIGLRINPDVDAKTHAYITTGKKENKFGISLNDAFKIYKTANRYRNLEFIGIHTHIGSQITSVQPYVEAIKKAVDFRNKLKYDGIKIDYFNIGGGLGIIYDKESPAKASEFATSLKPLLRGLNCSLILEPGRFITGNAGILLTKVLFVKKSANKKFIIVDAAMNDLIRPSLYNAYHKIVPLRKSGRKKSSDIVDIVGPVCESGDFFARDRRLPFVESNDVLAILSAGAYGFSMSSNYNSRTRATEVLVKNDKCYLIRRRETYLDLIRNEKIPAILVKSGQKNGKK